jgi:hypothetical protein
MKCQLCNAREAIAFGPWSSEDLFCEECVTDPAEVKAETRRDLRRSAVIFGLTAVTVLIFRATNAADVVACLVIGAVLCRAYCWIGKGP